MAKLIDLAGLGHFLEKLKERFVPISGGTMSGSLVANTSRDQNARQVRNITFSTDSPEDEDGEDGDIWIVLRN